MMSVVSLPERQAVSLIKSLFELRDQRYTGLVHATGQVPETKAKLECYLLLKGGYLALTERSILSNYGLVKRILKRLQVKCIDQIMEYAAHRIDINSVSPCQVLETIAATRIVSWEDLEKAIIDYMVVIIEQFATYPCTIMPLPVQFDMTCETDHQGIDCSLIAHRIEQRQTYWKQYLPAIHSVHAIPFLKEGAINTVSDPQTKQHLENYVDGKRSLADIAEVLQQDPLLLAPFYFRWVHEGLVGFNFGVHSVTKVTTLPVILSIDDSPVVQAMIRRNLAENYEVICASSAMEALGILSHRSVDLILLDVTMPEIDGFEFCHTIRKMKKFKNTPVIMLTAKDGLIDRARGHLAGTNRYLTKPVDKEELLQAIKEYIS